MPTIFISYRRAHTADDVGRMREWLVERFGDAAVFLDNASILPGTDFRARLNEVLARCDALLAVMDENWLEADQNGKRRIDDPEDWVRIEIETALRRGVPVIPVLVGKAEMPRPGQLPDTLKDLVYRQNVKVARKGPVRIHAKRLVRRLEELFGFPEQPIGGNRFVQWMWPFVPVALVLLFLVGVLAALPSEIPAFIRLLLSVGLIVLAGVAHRLLVGRTGRAEQFFLWVVLIWFAAMLFILVPCLFWGEPLDLRKYVGTSIVVRKDYPESEIKLKPHWGPTFLAQDDGQDLGKEDRLRSNMTVWKKWVRKGVLSPGSRNKLLAYQSNPFQDYYEPFDAKLVFAAGLNAKLMEGVAFLKRIDSSTNEETYHQLRFYIPAENVDPKPGQNATENAIERIVINPGDHLVILTLLGPLDRNDLPGNLEAYAASLKRQ